MTIKMKERKKDVKTWVGNLGFDILPTSIGYLRATEWRTGKQADYDTGRWHRQADTSSYTMWERRESKKSCPWKWQTISFSLPVLISFISLFTHNIIPSYHCQEWFLVLVSHKALRPSPKCVPAKYTMQQIEVRTPPTHTHTDTPTPTHTPCKWPTCPTNSAGSLKKPGTFSGYGSPLVLSHLIHRTLPRFRRSHAQFALLT